MRYFIQLPISLYYSVQIIIVIFLVLTSKPLYSADLSPEKLEPNNSVISLFSTTNNSCGNGFFIAPTKLVTANHVYNSICPNKEACVVRLFKNSKSPTIKTELSADNIFHALDLVVLNTNNYSHQHSLSLSKLEISNFSKGVKLVGYNGCSQLVVNEGSILESNNLHLTTTIQGSFGLSGSPLLDLQNHLVGIITSSNDFNSALFGRLTSTSFALKAINATPLRTMEKEPSEQIEVMLDRMLNFFFSSLDTNYFSKISNQLEFLSIVSDFYYDLYQTSELTNSLVYYWPEQYPSFLANSLNVSSPISSLEEKIEQLSLAAAITKRGLNSSLLRKADESYLLSYIEQANRSEQAKKRLKLIIKSSAKLPALVQAIAKLSIKLIFGLIVVLFLWSWSLALVFYKTNKSFLGRAVNTIIVGLLFWPLSFVIWYFTQKSSKS